MKKIIVPLISSVLILFNFLSVNGSSEKLQLNPDDSLNGWFQAGSKPDAYKIGRDKSIDFEGHTPYYMKSVKDIDEGFGTIMRYFIAKKYIGKRLRLSGYIKTEKLADWGGMWFRIDDDVPGKMRGFDNMMDRPIRGTTDWTKYEEVLDVPKGSAGIAYGVLFNGTGQVWFNELKLEEVSNDVPVTNMLPADTTQMEVPETSNYDELPEALKDIPTGLEIKHSPNVVYASLNGKDSMYYWLHQTSVKAYEEMEMVEFGAYQWLLNHWEFGTVTGKPFTKDDFTQWYNCKNGILKKGKVYKDKSNWSRNLTLTKQKALWYYIAKNKEGKLFKGTAMIDYLPEVKK